MERIKVMIVEDKQLIAEDMASKLKKHNIDVTGIYSSGENALEALESDIPDLVIMDIQLAGAVDGISAAKMMTDKHPIPVIYLSDHVDDTTVERAFRTQPASYLQKPFVESDLIRTVKLTFSNSKELGKSIRGFADHIFIKIDTAQTKVLYDDIFYLQADGAYCTVFTAEKGHLQAISMNHVLDQLDHKNFVRIHRSHVVNITKVSRVDGNVLTLGKYKVEMSKSMRENVLKRLNFLK